MKITKKELETIIQEELEATLNEFDVASKIARGAEIIIKGALNVGKKAARGAEIISKAITAPVSSAIGSAASEQEYKRHFSEHFKNNPREAKSQALSYFARYLDGIDDYDKIINILVDHWNKAGQPTSEAD